MESRADLYCKLHCIALSTYLIHILQELLQYCYNLSVDGFTLLTEYLRVCIEQRRLDRIKTNRRQALKSPLLQSSFLFCRKILREVFYMWDKDELNMVARQELLDLLTAYYNTAPPDVREKLSDPENCELTVILYVSKIN